MKFERLVLVLLTTGLGLIGKAETDIRDAGLRETNLASLGGTYQSSRHAARPVEGAAGEWQLQNPANGLAARFDSAGMSMKVRLNCGDGRSISPSIRWNTLAAEACKTSQPLVNGSAAG